MAVTLADAAYTLACIRGYPGTRAEWDAYQARQRARERWETRQEARARFRKARRAHGARRAAPRWQRGARRPRSIESSMQDPRVRGQLAITV